MKQIEQYSETELVEKILEGETGLFEILIRRNNSYLYKTGRAYNYNHEDTQDLMQDTYIDAYVNLSGFERRSSFRTWIMKIMLNNCFKKHNKSGFKNEVFREINERSIPAFTEKNHTDTSKVVMNKELNIVIQNALQKVPVDYRMVFAFREMNGLSVRETAEILAISEANVKVRLNRAKSMLRKEVEKSYSSDDIFELNLIYCDLISDRVMKKINEIAIRTREVQ